MARWRITPGSLIGPGDPVRRPPCPVPSRPGWSAPRTLAVQAELLAGNFAYEERFGRIFPIARRGPECPGDPGCLEPAAPALARSRGPAVAEQPREIALIRLEGVRGTHESDHHPHPRYVGRTTGSRGQRSNSARTMRCDRHGRDGCGRPAHRARARVTSNPDVPPALPRSASTSGMAAGETFYPGVSIDFLGCR